MSQPGDGLDKMRFTYRELVRIVARSILTHSNRLTMGYDGTSRYGTGKFKVSRRLALQVWTVTLPLAEGKVFYQRCQFVPLVDRKFGFQLDTGDGWI